MLRNRTDSPRCVGVSHVLFCHHKWFTMPISNMLVFSDKLSGHNFHVYLLGPNSFESVTVVHVITCF